MRWYLVASISWLALACGSPNDSLLSSSTVAPDALGDETIFIDPTEIDIVGPIGQTASMTYKIAGTSTHLASLQWVNDTGNVFDSIDPLCPAGICPYGNPGIPLPKTGTLSCIPSAVVRSAILQVNGNTGATGQATITCRPIGGSPSFTTPGIVGRISTAVGSTIPASLFITNTGPDPLMVSVALDGSSNAAAWTALDCASTPCPLAMGGTLTIDLEFSPTKHGDLDATIEVSGPPAVGTQTVMLLGTGLGGKLRVDEPDAPEFLLDFGTISKNQLVTLPIQMTNVGNADLAVTPSNPGAPFTVSTMPLTIPNAQQGMISVSCMAGSPMAPQTKTIALTTDAYEQTTPSVEVRCAIANTTVQVTSPLDFGELRVDDPAGELEVVVANPAGNPQVTIERLKLVGATNLPALTLDAPAFPATLAAGAQLTATLSLATIADTTLDGVSLEVEITEAETVTLSQPVTGTVGSPAAVVLPGQLELGSVCLGTPVDGEITMSNIGTATLTMQRPTMSSTSFVPLYTNPTDYPEGGAPLASGDKATVGVMLASSTAGVQEGTLEWDVDAPGAPFQTKVSVELLMEGTAVSPAVLRFGGIEIAEPPTMMQTITLENCGPDPAIVSYDRVTASEGSTSAWKLDPPSQQRELLPDETMRVRVAFDPERPGRHLAELHVNVDGGEKIVIFEGEATGLLPEETSFYACGCSGSSDPTRGWPIFLAVPFVLRRRRC